MKPLIVLIGVFALSLLVIRIARGSFEYAVAGRIAMSSMLVFTAIGHFVFTKGMSMMLPDFIPYKTAIVHLTGVIEIVAAIGLFFPSVRVLTGWLLILFFILLLPANVYASINHINYETGTPDGNGLAYLWFRVPLQLLFILWTYLCAIRV